ncbi:tyrosine-type recombinase/integrase [Methylobacterium symbioticum]|uniref:tyrosine-type recombinase/integrase n=1 Tax=Methylobacterium symbioticum TaxID=2584084 RepID=UPI001AEE5827|nr:tyrosine-type recombinase/integrase [Methylobacterium symbioticum]
MAADDTVGQEEARFQTSRTLYQPVGPAFPGALRPGGRSGNNEFPLTPARLPGQGARESPALGALAVEADGRRHRPAEAAVVFGPGVPFGGALADEDLGRARLGGQSRRAGGNSAALTETNPARDVPYLQGCTDGFHTWSLDEVTQFIARHPPGTKGYLALALLLFTGCRRSDVVALGRQHIPAGWLRYTQHTNRNRAPVTLDLQVLPVLQAAIDTMPARPAVHETELAFLIRQFGRPFTANGFGNWFRKRCEEAGLIDCDAHALRKAGATLAAESGATELQLMAIYGWRNPKQAAVYTRKARQTILAGGALHLIRLDPVGIVACPTSTEIPSGGTNSVFK